MTSDVNFHEHFENVIIYHTNFLSTKSFDII